MFRSVLIANRGEIACRIIRTARALGMRTIAVHSDVDASALHVRMADEAHRIGPAAASASYLSIPAIIEAARESGAECVHPGYGFLSEHAEFAEACAAAGIVFIGPSPAAIRAMGLKDAAKAIMQKAGVPVVQGYHGPRQEPQFLRDKARETGYPVLIKAVAGGGGRGLRRVDAHVDFESILADAQREAAAAFGNSHVLIEKLVARPRHVEVQIIADRHGRVVHLGERDCSLQRRRQKIVEEAPAPGLGAVLRRKLGEAAVAAAAAVAYEGAGTVEFIVDASGTLDDAPFYFMEMNTRLQVEHPVTEAVTGLDLVDLQFRVAAGEPLGFAQEDVAISGHAIEVRLYAEDPAAEFLPCPGHVVAFECPPVALARVDAGVEAGDDIVGEYDPLIAKIVVQGTSRDEALAALGRALRATLVAGPRTNLAFLRALSVAPFMRSATYDTTSVEQNLQSLGATPRDLDRQAAATGLAHFIGLEQVATDDLDPWSQADGFSLLPHPPAPRPFIADGRRHVASLRCDEAGFHVEIDGVPAVKPGGEIRLFESGTSLLLVRAGRQTELRLPDARDVAVLPGEEGSTVIAPLHGRLVELRVSVGDRIQQGARVGTLEAMKLAHALVAPRSGLVREVLAREGDQVGRGAQILVIGD